MLATLLILAFLAAAVLATAVISATLAKGFAAVASVRRQLARCCDERMVTVRHERIRARPVVTARVSRRPVRPTFLPAASRQRVAA